MKKIYYILRKCKTFSRQLSRSSSYSSLRSKSTRYPDPDTDRYYLQGEKDACETIFVGSSRRRYVISSKHLNHPLLSALIEKSGDATGLGPGRNPDLLSVKCEVVLFDHLLWMLENADPDSRDSLEELAELYVY
ncbi:hypothetical protein ABFS83_13G148200 [Erythranthe nasuta]